MTGPTALSDAELALLFAPLERYDVLLLAVSGGADSMALMHLVAGWRAGRPAGPVVHVATVDHALRATSHQEAKAVGDAARALGLPHHVLTWAGPKPAAGVQAAARAARYDLLGAKLGRLASRNAALVTAHTADDQAETLLMRLARGSGVDGLAAMAQSRPLAPGKPFALLRPLLAVPKERLVATLAARAVAWFDDPSNTDLAFERVRLRAAAPARAALGLGAKPLAATATRLHRARQALEWATSDLEQRVLDVNGGAFAKMDRAAFAAAPEELQLRLLARVLSRFGGAAPPARLSRLEALLRRLAHATPVTATLGGCVVVATASTLSVFREPGRRGLPQCDIGTGGPVRWDDRFLVRAEGVSPRPLSVRALGLPAYARLRTALDRPLPARAAATLPAFWSGSDLMAVPLLALKPGHLPPIGSLRLHTDFLGLPEEAHICD